MNWMRNLATNNTPSLFPTEPMPTAPPAIEETEREEAKPRELAREFVRWCCSFGRDFHNSPDAANLRYWLHKTGITPSDIPDIDEDELLHEARRLFLKRIEQSLAT